MKAEFAFGEKKLNSADIKSSVYGHVLVAAAPLAAFPTAATDILVWYHEMSESNKRRDGEHVVWKRTFTQELSC